MNNKNQPQGKIKFSRLRLSQKPITATNATGVKSLTLSANRTHISSFFRKSTDDASQKIVPSTSTESIEEETVANDNQNSDRKRRSDSPCEKSSMTSYGEEASLTSKKPKFDKAQVTQSAPAMTTRTRSGNTKSSRTNASHQIKSETIKNFFSSEKDDSFLDFQLNDKPMPKSKSVTTKLLPKRKAPLRKKQPDIRKCLQKPCSEETFNQFISDHCALDNMDPDQLQLALAMSRSLAENEQSVASGASNDTKSTGVCETVKETIEKFSFRSRLSTKNDGDFAPFFGLQQARGRKKKWQSRCTALTRRVEKFQMEKLKKKIAHILMESITANRRPQPEIACPAYEVTSNTLHKYLIPEKILFNVNSTECDSTQNSSMYYTNNLVSPTKIKSGVLLRDWASIPGRDDLFDCVPESVRQKSTNHEMIPEEIDADEPTKNAVPANMPETDMSDPSEEPADIAIEDDNSGNSPKAGTSNTYSRDASEQNEVAVDMETNILIDNDDIQGKLDLINVHIQNSQILNASAERIRNIRYTSFDKSDRLSRESSPDIFADCDSPDHRSDDSDTKNIRGLPFDDRDSAEMCDIVIAETPTNYNDAIEIISISSSLSNSEKEKLTDSQINGLSSADNMLSADVMSDVGHSSISQKCQLSAEFERPDSDEKSVSAEVLAGTKENYSDEMSVIITSPLRYEFGDSDGINIDNVSSVEHNYKNISNRNQHANDIFGDGSKRDSRKICSPDSPLMAVNVNSSLFDSIELSDDDIAVGEIDDNSASKKGHFQSADYFNRSFDLSTFPARTDMNKSEFPLSRPSKPNDSIEISDDEAKSPINSSSMEEPVRINAYHEIDSNTVEQLPSQNYNKTQDSIEISDDEINYSMNRSKTCNQSAIDREKSDRPLPFSQNIALSQESIEISDDEINYSLNKSCVTFNYNTIEENIKSIESWKPSLFDPSQDISDGERTILLNDSWTKLVNVDNENHSAGLRRMSNACTSNIPSTPTNAERSTTRPSLPSMIISDSINNEFENSSMMNFKANCSIDRKESRQSLASTSKQRSPSPINVEDEDGIKQGNSSDIISKVNPITTSNIVADVGEDENDDIAAEDFVNQSISRIFESSFKYKKHTLTRTPQSNVSKFRKTQSEVFPEHHFDLDMDMGMDDSGEVVEHNVNDSPLVISNSQYQKLSDEFDRLVYGTPQCATTKQPKTPRQSIAVVNQRQRSTIDELALDMSNENYIIKIGSILAKPDYESMTMDEILEESKKYGLKLSLKRRQAIICLEHIYNRTHPYVEYTVKTSGAKSSRGRSGSIAGGALTQSKQCDAISDDLKSLKANQTKIDFNIGFACDNIVAPIYNGAGDDNLQIFLPSNPRAKKPWCLQPLHIAWYNLLRANSAINQHMLLYKPINLNDLKMFYKSIDMNFENKDLIAFLDLHCITFQTNKANNN